MCIRLPLVLLLAAASQAVHSSETVHGFDAGLAGLYNGWDDSYAAVDEATARQIIPAGIFEQLADEHDNSPADAEQAEDAEEEPKRRRLRDRIRDRREDPKSWYVTYGLGPSGLPITYYTKLTAGFVIRNRIDMGFFIGTAGVNNGFADRILGVINDAIVSGNLDCDDDQVPDELCEAAEQITSGEIASGDAEVRDVFASEVGFEIKFTGNRLIFPLRLRTLNFAAADESGRALERLFRLKGEYKTGNDAADRVRLARVVDENNFTFFSFALASRYAFRWGGVVEVSWLSLELPLSQPEELEPILNAGLFGVDFGLRL